MFLDTLIGHARASFERRRRYNRLVAEIEGLSHRELAELRADRGDMLRAVREDIYGR